VIENPARRETLAVLATASDTGGELFAYELAVEANGPGPGGHVHPKQEERFLVLSGAVRFRRGMHTLVARPGDTVVVPPNTYHRFTNVGDGPARLRIEVRPALRMEELYRSTMAMAWDRRTRTTGMPRPLEVALLLREFKEEVEVPIAPGVARLVLAPLAWLGTRRLMSWWEAPDARW
jgi:mannose-6-phosphate isomerase-like protein (cupin superfamily)